MVSLPFNECSLHNGASYKYEDGGKTALYLNGQGAYADTPAVSLQFPAFTITFWLKVLEPANTPGPVYSDWWSPHQFQIWLHGEWKQLSFWLRSNTPGENLCAFYSEYVVAIIFIGLDSIQIERSNELLSLVFTGCKQKHA